MADAHCAGQAAAAATEPTVAGRADEPSRFGSPQLAGRVSIAVSARLCADLARPLLPGRDGQEDRRNLEQANTFLSGKLRQVPGAESAAARAGGSRVSDAERAHRAAGDVH